MALLQYTVTLGAGPTRAIATHLSMNMLIIENEEANDLVRYGTSEVTTTDYAGSTMDNPKTIGPFPQGCMNLDEFYFLGTENNKIHLTVITP